MFSASTPAVGYSVTGTGAVSNTLFPTFLQRGSYTTDSNSTNTNTTVPFGFLMGGPAFTANATTLPLWSAVGDNNAGGPLPDNTPDLSQRIVLLEFPDSRATQCYPQDQGDNIAAKGGRFLLYYERTNTYVATPSILYLYHYSMSNTSSTMRDDPLLYSEGIQGVARAILYQAEHWLSLLEQGSTVIVTVPGANSSQVYLEELENNMSGGYVAGQLSSWGPSWELSMSPQLVSPGENILSTYPTALGSYRVMTGTSMGTISFLTFYCCLLRSVSDTVGVWRVRIARRSVWQDRSQALTPDSDFHRKATCVARRQDSPSRHPRPSAAARRWYRSSLACGPHDHRAQC
jgi:hypothetical protein